MFYQAGRTKLAVLCLGERSLIKNVTSMDLQLKGKKAFISGSTQGIGYGIARQIAREGATVILNGRGKEKLDAAIEKLKTEVPDAIVSGIVADFGKIEEVNALISELGDIDI